MGKKLQSILQRNYLVRLPKQKFLLDMRKHINEEEPIPHKKTPCPSGPITTNNIDIAFTLRKNLVI